MCIYLYSNIHLLVIYNDTYMTPPLTFLVSICNCPNSRLYLHLSVNYKK